MFEPDGKMEMESQWLIVFDTKLLSYFRFVALISIPKVFCTYTGLTVLLELFSQIRQIFLEKSSFVKS